MNHIWLDLLSENIQLCGLAKNGERKRERERNGEKREGSGRNKQNDYKSQTWNEKWIVLMAIAQLGFLPFFLSFLPLLNPFPQPPSIPGQAEINFDHSFNVYNTCFKCYSIFFFSILLSFHSPSSFFPSSFLSFFPSFFFLFIPPSPIPINWWVFVEEWDCV